MKKNSLGTCLVLGWFGVLGSMHPGISGNWRGVAQLADGRKLALQYTLAADHHQLTGKVRGADFQYGLQEGTIAGDSISFALEENGNKIFNRGKYFVSGDSISLDYFTLGSPALHVLLLRSVPSH